jgi:hypothetical protein
MAYRINKTDGSLLTNLTSGTIDQLSTSLTLIGSDYSGYGEFINENFLHLLESFANTSEPTNPITGQVWFDSSVSQLKVYNGTEFKVSGGPIIQETRPTAPSMGDVWINSSTNQLSFYDGTDMILVGPIKNVATLDDLKLKPIPLFLHVGDRPEDAWDEFVRESLKMVAPPTEYKDGATAKILCTTSDQSTIFKFYTLLAGDWVLQ